jgi:hypothetical protein
MAKMIPMEQLAEAVKAGVVGAMEEREAGAVNGGLAQQNPFILEGFFPSEPFSGM